jgi:hypothetical protein
MPMIAAGFWMSGAKPISRMISATISTALTA